jgi:hypothetical protein
VNLDEVLHVCATITREKDEIIHNHERKRGMHLGLGVPGVGWGTGLELVLELNPF